MKGRNLFILGGLALSICLNAPFAMAAGPETKKDEPTKSQDPSAEELKQSKDRAIILLPPRGASMVKPPVVRQEPVQKVEIKKPVATSKANDLKISPASKKPVKKVTTAAPTAAVTTVKPAVTRPGTQVQTVSRREEPVKVQPAGEAIISAWLNKGGNKPNYKNGEKMTINVTANQDCNIMIFDYDGKGKLTQIFPNDYQQNGSLKTGDSISIGGTESPFEYQVSGAKGKERVKERIFVYAYPTNEKPMAIAMNHEASSPFRSGEMTIGQYRQLVNESRVFFSKDVKEVAGEREVKIVPKHNTTAAKPGLQLASNTEEVSESNSSAPNKLELTFEITEK